VKSGIAVSALALVFATAPAEAGQARAVMSVTAIVSPACSVALRESAAMACSTGASVSTITTARPDEQPLAQAEALLGRPVRRGRAIAFTTRVAPAQPPKAGVQPGLRYLTITY